MKRVLFLGNGTSPMASRIRAELPSEGFDILEASLPGGGMDHWVDTVRTTQPDVLLMEVGYPHYLDHYRICHELRQDPILQAVPILLLAEPEGPDTAHDVGYLLEGLNAGANDYLKLPYEMAEIIAKLNTAYRLRASLDKARVLTEQLNTVNDELYQRNVKVEKEMYVARQLQQSLLPHAMPIADDSEDAPLFTRIHFQDARLRISGIYLPCDALGGDLYDVLKFPDGTLGVSITDVSGHGLPAGFITAIFKTSLYRITQQFPDPADVLKHLNNELFDIVKSGDYVTSLYLRLDLGAMVAECAGAGHPYPFYYNAATDNMIRLKENGTPLVWVRDMDYPKDTVSLAPGDKLFIFTDGVSELKNPAGDMFGEERIEACLREAMAIGASFLTDYLIGTLSDFTEGAALDDDISMVMIEIL